MEASILLSLALAVGSSQGCNSALSSNAAAAPEGARQDVVELLAVKPESGPVGTTVLLHGKGIGEAGAIVRFGQGYIRDVKVAERGAALTFIVPDGIDLCAPGMTPCAGGFARVAPGPYDLSVITSKGESGKRRFTVSAR